MYIKHIFIYVLAIEDDYTGPVLENGQVTLKFVQDLLETFKDQKKLHSRFAFQVKKKGGGSYIFSKKNEGVLSLTLMGVNVSELSPFNKCWIYVLWLMTLVSYVKSFILLQNRFQV